MRPKTFIFDLDGTLLDTLADLADAVNYALAAHGLPTHSYDAIRMMVGNGVRALVERAVTSSAPLEPGAKGIDDIFATFKTYYVSHCRVKTRPYDGVLGVLAALRQRGHRVAIVSNKLQDGVTALQREYFDGLVEVAIGEREGVRRKPAPDMVEAALCALCGEGETVDELRQRAVYIGDSDVDILTARAAGLPCVSVLWGFRDEAFLREHGAEHLIHRPEELLD